MRSDQIQYRTYRNQDYAAAIHMVMEAWRYNEWLPPKTAKAMGEYYTAELLAGSNEVWIAEKDGEAVGIAAVKNNRKRKKRLGYVIRRFLACARILLCGQGKSEFFQFIKTEELDEELLKESGRSYDAELTLLIVRPGMKGAGIGDRLYREVWDYLERENLQTICLFTDSSCNYGFYEHKGMRRIAQKTFYWKSEDEEKEGIPEEYYLYEVSKEKLN